MTRTLTVIGVDGTQPPPFRRVTDAINFELKDRGVLGNLEASEQSFDVCFTEAVRKLGGEFTVIGRDDYYVALDGAPLASVLPKGETA